MSTVHCIPDRIGIVIAPLGVVLPTHLAAVTHCRRYLFDGGGLSCPIAAYSLPQMYTSPALYETNSLYCVHPLSCRFPSRVFFPLVSPLGMAGIMWRVSDDNGSILLLARK